MTDLLLGIDVGTSACKAAVVDAGGAERAHGQAPTPWRKVPTGAEIDPRALLGAALAAAAAALTAQAPPSEAGDMPMDEVYRGKRRHPQPERWRDRQAVAAEVGVARRGEKD